MEYINWLKNIKGFSDRTIEVYRRYIFELKLYGDDYTKLINKYSSKSNSTKRLILSAVKSYYTFNKDIRAGEISLPKKHYTISDYVSYEQYQGYLGKINKRCKTGFQKYVIVRLLFETGIRASELLWITQSDLSENRIKIKGKGNKERYIFVSKWLRADVEEYVKLIKTERLFAFTYKNLYTKIQKMDSTRVLKPHMFRHGFAKYCYQKGISIYDISLSMGHSDLNTTSKYINRNSEDVRVHTIF